MIDMRWYHWYVTDDEGKQHEKKKLQYRQHVHVRSNDSRAWRDGHRVMRWSPWRDIKSVWEDEL